MTLVAVTGHNFADEYLSERQDCLKNELQFIYELLDPDDSDARRTIRRC
jgi:hypothetical protein